jgi:hypothetical protein
MSWRASVLPVGEQNWVGNSLRFATREEADAYGKDLFSRWTGAAKIEPAESAEPVNYVWAGRLLKIEDDLDAAVS